MTDSEKRPVAVIHEVRVYLHRAPESGRWGYRVSVGDRDYWHPDAFDSILEALRKAGDKIADDALMTILRRDEPGGLR